MARQHMLHLTGADAEGQSAERAVGGGMAIATNHRHPRLRQPLLRPDDVDNALIRAVRPIIRNAEIAAVLLELRDLRFGDLVDNRQ